MGDPVQAGQVWQNLSHPALMITIVSNVYGWTTYRINNQWSHDGSPATGLISTAALPLHYRLQGETS